MLKRFSRTAKGFFWVIVDKIGSQILGLIVSVILARILQPQDFGLVALAAIFLGFSNSFSDAGLRDSLIQKSDISEKDYNSVFVFNLVVSVLFFVLIFILAEPIENYFRQPLSIYIKFFAFLPVLNSLSYVQTAILQKELSFALLAKIRITSFLIAGVCAILAALRSLGVWALIIQAYSEIIIVNVLLWYKAQWKPNFKFDKNTIKYHLQHGLRLLLINILNNISKHATTFFIGKNFSASQLGLFNRADTFKSIVYENTVGLVKSFSYPNLVKLQHNTNLLAEKYRTVQKITVLITLGVCVVLYCICHPLIILVLTQKWEGSIIIFKILLLSVALTPFNAINLNVLKALRRTDLFLKSEIIQKLILFLVLFILQHHPFLYIVYAQIVIGLVYYPITNYFLNQTISLSVKSQLKDTFYPIVLFVLLIFSFEFFEVQRFYSLENLYLDICLKGLIVSSLYFIPLLILERKSFGEILNMIKNK